MVRGYGEPSLDSAKVNVMVEFCHRHQLPLSICINAGRAWNIAGLKGAWSVLDGAAEDERVAREFQGREV